MFEKDWAQFEPKDSYSLQAFGGSSSSKPNPLVQLDPGLFIWTIITFLLVLFLLSKFAWKPLLKVLQEREDEIKSSLKDAEVAKTELEKVNLESEKILNNARAEARKIQAESKSVSEKQRDEIIHKAKEEAKKIVVNAESQIKMEKDLAIKQIQEKVIELTFSISEKVIKKNLTSDDNKKIIKDSLKSLEKFDA